MQALNYLQHKLFFLSVIVALLLQLSLHAQTCPSLFHRNNGNGQASSCAGASSNNPEATSVMLTPYDYDSLGIGSLSKQGDIQFDFPISTGPGFEPAIKTIWDATTVLSAVAGPPAPFGTFASNHRSSYCFYTTNLPPANRLTVEFVNPANGTTYAICSYDNQGNSYNPPTINTQPASQSVCIGSNVTFSVSASAVYGGTLTYQWRKNGVNISGATSSSYTINNVSTNNAGNYNVIINESNGGMTSSNVATLTVNNSITPSVSIAANPGTTICSGTSVTFTATPTNGGSTPAYQWKKNGVNVGTNSISYTESGLANNDAITCVLTSNATCASPTTATSGTLTMTVNGNVTPSVSIAANPGTTICAGTSVTFTATPTNGGSTPAYQWKKNGVNVGTNSTTYTDNSLANNDAITCVMTSNATCASPTTATSNSLTMTVNSQAAEPGAFTTSSAITYQGQTSVVYTVPNVAGVTYSWSYSGTGATINGSGNSVTVDFSTSATSGNLCVTATGSSCGASPSRCMAITVKPYETWTCGTNNDWNNPANWDGGFVPYGTISVLIPSGTPCNPSICSSNANVYNVTVNNGATVNICCSYNMNVNHDLTLNGSVLGCGYLTMTGSACHVIYGKGRVDNFELNNSCGGIINSSDTLHIGKTYKPTLGVMTVNGELELLSDSTATAEVLTHPGTCSNYINGDVICDKYIHGGRRAFRFLSHPFTASIGLNQLTPYIDITGQGGAANGFTTTTTNNPSAFWYNTILGTGSNTNDTGWTAFTNTNGVGANAWKRFEGIRLMFRGSPGQGLGCSICVPDPVTIKMHGPINECDEVVSLATNANLGYNFVGNPYPSNIDLSQCTRGSAIGANFSVWDPNQGVYGAYVDQPFNISYILPAYSAFFTTCNAASNNTITFHEGDKTASAASGNLFKTTNGFGNDVVQLRILSNNDSLSWDRLLLFFNGQAMSGTDNLDNKKLYNPGISFYTYSTDNSQLSIDVRPYISNQVIQLGLQNADQMDYAIRVDDYSVPAGATLYLHDKYLNQVQALSQGMHYNFSVTSDPASQGDNRFELNLSGTTSVSSVAAGNDFKVNMMPNPATDNATISFEAPQPGNTIIRVSSITGQVVYTNAIGDVQNGKVALPLQNLVPGMYFVNIACGNYSVTQRLVKQ